jgi:hypothetical protein
VPGANKVTVEALVKKYMADGQLSKADTAKVNINQAAPLVVNGTTVGATLVTVDYPFEFVMLQPVARLVVKDSEAGEALSMRATSLMRNEVQ